MKRDVLICLDLELPRSFVPKPVDGEVDKFELHTIDWVLDCVQRGGPNGYKPNCNLVIIDFFIRLVTVILFRVLFRQLYSLVALFYNAC